MKMPHITVELIEGRTIEQKRKLVEGITQVVVDSLKVPPEAVAISLQDKKREDLAKAGKLYSDQAPGK
jgi:4-oxalocrotonate tautomerase